MLTGIGVLLLVQSIKRQSARVLQERQQGRSPDPLLLTREDLLGPREVDVSRCKPLQQLQGMRGLGRVKESVSNLLQLIKTNVELEEQERPLKAVCLNRVFLGNPGTGGRICATSVIDVAAPGHCGEVAMEHWQKHTKLIQTVTGSLFSHWYCSQCMGVEARCTLNVVRRGRSSPQRLACRPAAQARPRWPAYTARC
jgi:hypothetical protein